MRNELDGALNTTLGAGKKAGTVSSWWMVTADWLDPQTGRILTFRSRRLKFPPHHHIGERIVVYFDASGPKHYRMEL